MKRAAAFLMLLGACAPDLRDEYPFDGETSGGERVITETLTDGVLRTEVDASSKEAWVYFDLDTAKELPVSQALEAQAWDLAFQRFKIISNSGVSGPGSVAVAALPDESFESLTRAPVEGFQPDEPDGDDGNTDVDSAFLEGDGWYVYDLVKHRLQARDGIYVVRTGAGAYFKLRMLAYYDENGTAGRVSFDWAPVSSP